MSNSATTSLFINNTPSSDKYTKTNLLYKLIIYKPFIKTYVNFRIRVYGIEL